jgi:L-fuculose-phosphate aldolase
MRAALRAEVVATAQRMSAQGLSRGTSGNVSARVDGGMLITPTGMAYESLGPSDVVEVTETGRVGLGRRAPSSEWRLHLGVYARRPEIGAVVHTHSMFATTFSILRREIPAVHYMIAVAGTTAIRCTAYATFGSAELAENAAAALATGKACLLANHGLVAVGVDLGDAFRVAAEIETLAEQYWRALQIGEPVVLDGAEMARVAERFATYGRGAPLRARTELGAPSPDAGQDRSAQASEFGPGCAAKVR